MKVNKEQFKENEYFEKIFVKMFGDFRIDDNFNKDNNIKVYTNEDYVPSLN